MNLLTRKTNTLQRGCQDYYLNTQELKSECYVSVANDQMNLCICADYVIHPSSWYSCFCLKTNILISVNLFINVHFRLVHILNKVMEM